MDEFQLIDWIRAQRVPVFDALAVGIGDDAAVWKTEAGRQLLIAADMLLEGRHFDWQSATPEQVGHKALAVNLSDIAAMAGRPLTAVVSLALPLDSTGPNTEELGRRLMAGLLQTAEAFGVTVCGGDTNTWRNPAAINVTLLGTVEGRPVTRCGARAGDWLFVTGSLGGSLQGRHLQFTPRIEEALALHQAVDLHAMIDISDGLAGDVRHIADESGVGITLFAERIPISGAVPTSMPTEKRRQQAVTDGEDFELLFAVSEQDGRRLLADPPISTPLTHVGTVTADRELLWQLGDGSRSPLTERGWEHRT